MKKIRCYLDTESGITWNKGSVFHGIIMDMVDPEYADYLHENQLHPFSQSIILENDRCVWEVNALDDVASAQIVDRISQVDSVYSKHENETYRIVEKEIIEKDLDSMLTFGVGRRSAYLFFDSPTSFKRDNAYVTFPDIRSVFTSLLNQYRLLTGDEKNPELLESICMHTHAFCQCASEYKIKGRRFMIKECRVPAFTGYMQIYMDGPQTLTNFTNMLLSLGEFSGVGIKTSLGMGKFAVEERRRK